MQTFDSRESSFTTIDDDAAYRTFLRWRFHACAFVTVVAVWTNFFGPIFDFMALVVCKHLLSTFLIDGISEDLAKRRAAAAEPITAGPDESNLPMALVEDDPWA